MCVWFVCLFAIEYMNKCYDSYATLYISAFIQDLSVCSHFKTHIQKHMQTLVSCVIKCSAEAEQIKDKLSTFYFYSLVQCKQQTARHQGRTEVLLWATWTQWHPVVWLVGIIKQEHKCLVSSFHFLINKFVFTRKTT